MLSGRHSTLQIKAMRVLNWLLTLLPWIPLVYIYGLDLYSKIEAYRREKAIRSEKQAASARDDLARQRQREYRTTLNAANGFC